MSRCSFSIVALISTVVMWLTDAAFGGVLNLTVAERRNREGDREYVLLDVQDHHFGGLGFSFIHFYFPFLLKEVCGKESFH